MKRFFSFVTLSSVLCGHSFAAETRRPNIIVILADDMGFSDIGCDGGEIATNWPLQRGFDRYDGTIHGAGSYWDPGALVRDDKQITAVNDSEHRPKDANKP